MSLFGTDGIRGKVFKDINHQIAFDCGNALCKTKENVKIILGKDSRVSGDYLTLSFCLGVIYGGGSVDDVGLCPSAGVAYLTKALKYDYGVMISASHNPPDNNGIKIFASNGEKLGDEREKSLESKFGDYLIVDSMKLGKYVQKKNLVHKYEQFLIQAFDCDLSGVSIVLDCCFGASVRLAKNVFRKSGAKIKVINSTPCGTKINVSCGATNVTMLSKEVIKNHADLGLAFDGDSDRVIAVDENGEEVDGDKILYLLALDLKAKNKLKNNLVVGTVLTNLAIVEKLKEKNISMLLASVGDKYVIEQMKKNNSKLGGEKAGHIIISDYLDTGDGILAGIRLACVIKKQGMPLSKLLDINLYPQHSINILTENKEKIMSNEEFKKYVELMQKSNKNFRILVRKSGTENLLRIMVEGKEEEKAKEIASTIKDKVIEIEKGL